MSEERVFTVVFNRTELFWLYRQLASGRDRAEARTKQFTGELSPEQNAELTQAVKYFEELKKLVQGVKDSLDNGEREKMKLQALKEDLTEALDLVEEETAKEEIHKRLHDLPKEEDYRIAFDRETCKFTVALVENDLHKFRSQVIPEYEKMAAEEFTDPIQTKSYWVNKARKSKEILEKLKIKLERAL